MASLGLELREVREARRISIQEIASSTKIVPRYLEAIENDQLGIVPGGLFIRGIIRAYAKAIGLDGEEVLARYREAGLLGDAGRKVQAFPKAVAVPAPPPPPAFVTPPAPEPEPVPAPEPEPEPAAAAAPLGETAPLPVAPAAPGPLFEPAPKPRLSPAARKRLLALSWRLAAVAAVAAVLVIIWTSRRPRPPDAAPFAVAPAASLPGEPGPTAPRTAAEARPSAPAAEAAAKPEPAPPAEAEPAWKGVTIEIVFHDSTWIHVRSDGAIKIDGVFPAGTTARAQADQLLLIHTGNAGGFSFLLNGERARPLGRSGQVITDIRITPANFRDFLEARAPGGPPDG
ncbi:MAG TPA: DUF4115 domain-containing protein [Candidatus Aminicenantes bacterium]|nr:DUF4115 domain-containing protein [Candidatus Aminicenantes bacterium]